MKKRKDLSWLSGVNVIGLIVSISVLFFVLMGFPSTQTSSLVSDLSSEIDNTTDPIKIIGVLKDVSKVQDISEKASVSLFIIYFCFTVFVIIVLIINIIVTKNYSSNKET